MHSKCRRDRSPDSRFYPGMCVQHGDFYNMHQEWSLFTDFEQHLIFMLLSPTKEKYLILLPMYLREQKMSFSKAVLTLFSPCGFWALDPFVFSTCITLGALEIGFHPSTIKESRIDPSNFNNPSFTYVYVLDYICQAMLP